VIINTFIDVSPSRSESIEQVDDSPKFITREYVHDRRLVLGTSRDTCSPGSEKLCALACREFFSIDQGKKTLLGSMSPPHMHWDIRFQGQQVIFSSFPLFYFFYFFFHVGYPAYWEVNRSECTPELPVDFSDFSDGRPLSVSYQRQHHLMHRWQPEMNGSLRIESAESELEDGAGDPSCE